MLQPPIPDSAQRIVASLALEAKVSVEEVARLYKDKHAELANEARIKSFLPIFAVRSVQDVLRGRRLGVSPELATPHPYRNPVEKSRLEAGCGRA
jgi:hypothetical protein